MNKEYVSMQLVSGSTILCQASDKDGLDYYLVYYPLKPMAIGDRVVLVPMNPFSDETIYKIQKNHVVSIGSMNFTYIDDYNISIDRIEKSIKKQYEDITEIKQEKKQEAVGVEITTSKKHLH